VIFALALTVAVADATAVAPAPTVEIRTSRVGTLVHDVLCLARAVQCQADAIAKEADDDKVLDSLRTLDQALRRKRFGPDPFAERTAFPMPARDYDGHRRLRAEAFAAADLGALKTALAAWLGAEDAARATAAFQHFEARFAAHWQKAEPELLARQKTIRGWQKELDRFAGEAHRFFQSDFPAPGAFVVYLVDRPAGVRRALAERLSDVAVVDVAPEDLSFDVARAAMVQLVKAFYVFAPTKVHRDRMRALSSIESDGLLAAYTLFDDVLAYALTQDVLAKRVNEKLKAKTSPVIERLVVKVAPLLEASFGQKALTGGLSAEIVEAIIAAEGKELSTPRMALRYCEVAFDRSLTDARRELTKVLGAEQVIGYAPLDAPDTVDKLAPRHTSYMSVVWLVKPDELKRLGAHAAFFDDKTLAALGKVKAPFAFGVRRPVPTPAYVFVASSTDEFKKLYERFAAQPKPFFGAMP
jgi:hypothetical protein